MFFSDFLLDRLFTVPPYKFSCIQGQASVILRSESAIASEIHRPYLCINIDRHQNLSRLLHGLRQACTQANERTAISYRYGQFPWRDAKDQQCADQQVKGNRRIALFHHGYPGLTGVQFVRQCFLRKPLSLTDRLPGGAPL